MNVPLCIPSMGADGIHRMWTRWFDVDALQIKNHLKAYTLSN